MMIGEAPLTLQQMLQAMDIGLADEIKERQKFKSVRYSAINGQLLSENNRRYIYEFSLETPWDPEDDTNVVVKLAGTTGQDIKAHIVNSAGATIKIATEKPLPPEALRKVWLVDDSTQLLERLRETLKSIDEGSTFLGSKSFGLLPYNNNHLLSSVAFGPKFSPDISQQRAITLALGSEVTYIIGPPGTGKTATLAAIAFAHLCSGYSVLIAAHTNIAIDNAIMRLVDICNDSRTSTALQALEAGRLIRYGTPQLEDRIKDEYGSVHLPTIVSRHSISLNQQRQALSTLIDQITQQVRGMEQELAQITEHWQMKSQQLIAERDTAINRLHVLQEQEQARIADFQRRHHNLSGQRDHFQQQVHIFAQQQAHLSNQQIQQRTARTNYTSRINEIESVLTSAQQMNKLQRFFKGISTQDLARQHADNQQKRWSSEQTLVTLQKQMDELYVLRDEAEQQVGHLTLEISTLQAHHNIPTVEAQTLVQLQMAISKLEQDIAQINALNKPAHERAEGRLRQTTEHQEDLQGQIDLVESQLADIEKKIVSEAQVVATTLAKTYMNSNISERRFDVVIMDEVSMASLPGVYVVASHANQSVVIIGDPQQLPPIVQAKTNSAKEWLGRDLFALRRISLSPANAGQRDSVMLTEQARMHPHIADLVRQHVYRGLLNDSPRVMDNEIFQRYAAVQPLQGQPVLLCDTSDASPIATAPERKSRINAYHALCAIELARQALSTLPKRQLKKGEFRIGLITPYRKQAQLLQQLVKDAGLTDVIRAGTVHRFQGLEAEVIIFDTVESPGLRPSLLTAGVWGSDAMRLTNVAMTRAQHKLIIVANYPYLQQCLSEHDTLRLAVQEAHAASTILSSNFLHFSTHANISQASESTIRPGVNTTLRDHLYEPVFLDETTFFQQFEQDITLARKQIIIFSPFVEKDRTEKLIPLLAERHKAGIAITVVSRSGNTLPSRLKAEELLKGAGVQLRQPDDIKHEKFVFIDDEIAYVGSLNPLSQNISTEFMERVKSPSYVRLLKQFKQVDALVKAPVIWGPPIQITHDELPATSTTVCKCGRILVRRKNRKTQQPFYGCQAYSKSEPDHSTENVSQQHLNLIAKLAEMKCVRCTKPTFIRIGYNDLQIVCTDESTCGYRQRVRFYSDKSA